MKVLTIHSMEKQALILITFFTIAIFSNLKAQEIGYLTGANKIGISPKTIQPLYGFSVGMPINKHFAIETALFYSQRQVESLTQADYLTFAIIPKVGFFGPKTGFFLGMALALNPSLYHSNIENHTYLSTTPSLGGELYLGSKIWLDLKIGYDIGLTGAYVKGDIFKSYNGPVIFTGIKYRIK